MESSFAREYFSVLDTAHAGITGASEQILDRSFPDRLERWQRILYAVIRSTNPLLEFCLVNLERHPATEFTAALREYMRHGLEEEADHDTMLLDDLAKVGITKASLDQELPPAPITAMVGSQYYLIEQFHPAIHLGYIGLIEGYAPTMQDAAILMEKSGTPAEAWSTYRLHAEVDPDHREEL